MTVIPQPPDILSPQFAADPYPSYRVLRQHYPLHYHEGTGSWLISRYEDVERAFRDPVFTTATTTGSWNRCTAAGPSCR